MTSPTAVPLFIATPDAEPRGAVVVIQEAFGVTDHIEDVTRRAAAAGYYAVAPHLFHRSGDPVFGYDDRASVTPVLGALTADGIQADLKATLEHLTDAGFEPAGTGIIGFCMGGSVTTWAAVTQPVGAAVAFYGGGLAEGRFGFPPLLEIAASISSPWLGLFADEDQSIPTQDVERMRAAAATASVDTEVVRYPGTQHGFHCDARPAVFDAAAAADGWRRTLTWFDAHLAR